MARSKVIIEDNFAAIMKDMARIGMTAVEIVRQELGTCIGEIIDTTPQDTGMAASGWLKAADILAAKHVAINNGRVNRKNWKYENGKWVIDLAEYRSAALGRKQSDYRETHNERTIKRGQKKGEVVKKAVFEATNSVPHLTFIEYGHRITTPNGEITSTANHVIRDACRRMNQRMGPELYKALRVQIKRPKRYSRNRKVVNV